ncbi:MAG: hypothetical protein ACLPX8_04630 [Bryobacteraceae bacterium]|jgi:hypothetical protein
MKTWVWLAILTVWIAPWVRAQDEERGRKLESGGDAAGTRAALAEAARNRPQDAAALGEYAEFLDRYGDPGAREAYEKLLAALVRAGDSARAAALAKRLVGYDLLAGDRGAAATHAQAYRAATGETLALPGQTSAPAAAAMAVIPGPLRSFARMTAISGDAAPEDIFPALARNVVTNGYEASHSNEGLEQTEYLKLVHRYLSQARELEKMAGEAKVVSVPACDAANVGDLLRILGFRMRGGCGSELVLETVNAARAFITADSGFPVNKLEDALRTNRPFSYDFHPTIAPVLFGPEYWTSGNKETQDFLEALLGDPAVCRLYLGFSKLDYETAEALRKGGSYSHWKAYSHVLDFFGGMFQIRNGKAVIPGGARAETAWQEMVGVSPEKGAAFFDRLVAKDDGWLASLYDALARIDTPLRDYLLEPARMKRFYSAIRGRITSPGPARPVFRSNTDMMLLTTQLELDGAGRPRIPGSLEVWKRLFTDSPQGKYDGKLTRLAASWKEPDDLVEALFALCRKSVENEPLKIFMAISDIDRNRPAPLSPATVDKLARSYHNYGSQYTVFSESRRLSDKSIAQFFETVEAINKQRDTLERADAAGSFQALLALWQILVRDGAIAEDRADEAFLAISAPFVQVRGNRELFDASRNGVKALLASAGGATEGAGAQQRMLDLLAGATQSGNVEVREEVEQEVARILEAQHLSSLDTLLRLADLLNSGSKDKAVLAEIAKLAARVTEAPPPRAPLTASERNAMGFGYWSERHLDGERRLNFRLAVEKAGGDPARLRELSGLLAPSMRDTLLGFVYAHYAPPGAQVLYTNPVFVRSHDFIGSEGQSRMWKPTEPYGSGWPSNGGGRLVGSLAVLPYALAEAEQNFLVPAKTQALIWGDLVPQMILSAKIPTWWSVTPVEVHWVGLHLRYGRELMAGAAVDEKLRAEVTGELSRLASPARTAKLSRLLAEGEVQEAAEQTTPAELFLIARVLAPRRGGDGSPLGDELRRLERDNPKEANYAAISRAFGSPKPTLSNSYRPELLNLRTFPTLMGYSSRIMAESWESNTLYWAALADELSLDPAQLNVRIPEWTGKLVEHIFASHLEDWPALLKSLRLVGDDVRAHARAGDQKAAL